MKGVPIMSLTELLPSVRRLPASDKLRLIRILAEELEPDEDIYPLQPNKIYYLPKIIDDITCYLRSSLCKKLIDD